MGQGPITYIVMQGLRPCIVFTALGLRPSAELHLELHKTLVKGPAAPCCNANIKGQGPLILLRYRGREAPIA